jgi:hypothetical protein
MKRENLNTPINYLHSQSRPNRTPRQHRILMNRMGKIFRLFRPGGMTNADWYYKLTNKPHGYNRNLLKGV